MKRIISIIGTLCLCFGLVGIGCLYCLKEESKVEGAPTLKASKDSNTEMLPRMIQIHGTLYIDTGTESITLRNDVEGTITATVKSTEIPKEDNQSNFGIGYQYYPGYKDTYEVVLDGERRVFKKKNIVKLEKKGGGIIDLAYNLQDPIVFTQTFENIALIRVDSIYGADNYDPISNQYVSPYTYGMASVLKTIKGDIPKDKILFRRLGGKITLEQDIKGDSNKELRQKLHQEGPDKEIPLDQMILNIVALGDIGIEEGKIYLVSLSHPKSLEYESDIEQEYWIEGLQYGLREVKNVTDFSNYSLEQLKNIKVKDNDKNSWVYLSEVIDFFQIEK